MSKNLKSHFIPTTPEIFGRKLKIVFLGQTALGLFGFNWALTDEFSVLWSPAVGTTSAMFALLPRIQLSSCMFSVDHCFWKKIDDDFFIQRQAWTSLVSQGLT